jgi:hypothetical protein
MNEPRHTADTITSDALARLRATSAPAGLREQYAAAMRQAVSGAPDELPPNEELVIHDLTDAVMAVRDSELEQLRARLTNAEEGITAAVRHRKAAEDRARRAEAAVDRVREAIAPYRWTYAQVPAYVVRAALDEPKESRS